jgi:hypothetical protein
MEVPGDVENDTEITFDTPNFEKYGAVGVEGRVAVGGMFIVCIYVCLCI